MVAAIGCAVSYVLKSAAVELLAQGSSVLILLAAGILVFRTFREKYLLAWILGWLSYLVYEVTQSASFDPRSTTVVALSTSAFMVSVACFSSAILYYSNARRHLTVLAILAGIAVPAAIVRAVWLPNSSVATVVLHLLYMGMSVGAAIRLAMFIRGRRELGPWLAAMSLVFIHLDETPNAPHHAAGVDLAIQLLLGLSMLVIVLDDSKARARRLAVVTAITSAVAQAQNPAAMMTQALVELKKLLGARAVWYRVLQEDELVLVEQIGLSDRFVEVASELNSASSAAASNVVRQGQPRLFHLNDLDPATRQCFVDENLDHLLMVPVLGKTSVIGTLAIAGDHYRPYSDDETGFLETTAHQLGIAIENLHLLEQILRSQRQWVSTFDSIDDSILVHDSEFRLLKVNRALLRRLGRPIHKIINRTCESVLPAAQEWAGCPYCEHARNPVADAPDPAFGGHSLVSTSSYSEEGSETAGTIHIVRDTTERRAAEEKYRMLFEQVQEGVFISTPQGHLIDCNDAFVRMLGYDRRDEVLALDIAREVYVHPDQREAFRQEIAAQNYVRNYEVALRRKDGGIITALENSFATRDAAGRIERYQGFLLDITEKKRSEDEIRRRNRELYALNAIAVIATQSFDLDEILNVTLRQVVDLFAADTGSAYLFDTGTLTLRRRAGCGHRTDLGALFPEIKVSPEFWERIKAAHTEIITHRDVASLPPVVAEFAAAEDLHSWMWTIMWSQKKVIGLFGVSSHRRQEFSSMDENLLIAIGRQLATTIDKVHLYEETCRAYDDLRRTQEQLLQSEKMSAVGQMISGVAHELNNPLTAILGYAQLLETEDLGDRCQDYVQKLFKQAQRTQRVVQNLLSFARQHKPQKAQVDLRRVLEDTLALRDYDLKLNNISVDREFQAGLPTATADAHQLEQVFLNIVNNAVDAILETARSGVLTVRVYVKGQHVCTEIQDSGPGIKEPGRVFDPFYTTKVVGKGTGLGLSICYGIVKEHHGDIMAMNAPGGGALFRVLLPASGAVAPVEAKLAPKRRELVLHGRVLVVDDEEAVLDFEREVLTGAGAEVVTVTCGEDAISRLQRESFDAVILDAKMPGEWNGADLYRWIAENRPAQTKAVLFTVSNVSDVGTKAFLDETGAACIAKPFEVADLISMTRRILQKQQGAAAP